MNVNRAAIATTAAVAALAVGGVTIANAVGGGDGEKVSGPPAEKAKSAALQAVGGGTVTEVEGSDGDGSGAYEVEVTKPDGSQVDVYVSDSFQAIGQERGDDGAGENESGENESGENESGENESGETGNDD